jgi:hypothetical protein
MHSFFGKLNRGFEWLSNFYGRATSRLIRKGIIMLVI